MLFSAQSGAMVASLAVNLMLARWMEPREMGRFAFSLAVVAIGGLLFEFGIMSAGSRVLALARDEEEGRRALGALVVLTGSAGFAFSVFIAAVATPIDLIFDTDVRWLLISVAALAFFQPFQLLIEQSCQGLNQIGRLSAFQLTMSGSYMAMVGVLAASGRLTAQRVLMANLIGIGLAAGSTLVRMRPRFVETARNIKLTLKEIRGFGFNIYLARITATASSRLDNLVITYFLGGRPEGFAPLGLYAIAQRLGSPIVTLARALAITRFRAFASIASVPGAVTKWNLAAVTTLAAGLAIVGPVALGVVFPKYSAAASLLVPISILSLFAGLFQPYNAFLASHGRGAELRNIAFAVTVASLAGLFLLVPRFGVSGAAWSGAAAMALDYLLHLYYYRKFTRRVSE
jgi:O-antigen/teichoic acid export membrane protein